jgi:hypothetical protein
VYELQVPTGHGRRRKGIGQKKRIQKKKYRENENEERSKGTA